MAKKKREPAMTKRISATVHYDHFILRTSEGMFLLLDHTGEVLEKFGSLPFAMKAAKACRFAKGPVQTALAEVVAQEQEYEEKREDKAAKATT